MPFLNTRIQTGILLGTSALLALLTLIPAQAAETAWSWRTEGPLLTPRRVEGEDWISLKDPSVVREGGRWHLFCTVRGTRRSHAILYTSFEKWTSAETSPRTILPCHTGYFCAPQVFYFSPHRQWYLICQASDPAWSPEYQPSFATNASVGDPTAWSRLRPMWANAGAAPKPWLDFWVICDDRKAHIFFTSLDGKMWRSETTLARFPLGWNTPTLAIQGDIFEASHTYRVLGQNRYLTFVEAQNGDGWRYFKSYFADRLEGPWVPDAAEREKAFASMRNVSQPNGRWTDVVSHGELLRAGTNERLEVDLDQLKLLIQGVRDSDRAGKPYGQIPWRLGMLDLTPP